MFIILYKSEITLKSVTNRFFKKIKLQKCQNTIFQSEPHHDSRVSKARILNVKFIDIFEKAILENEPTVKPRPRIIPTNNQPYPNA